jgi:putative NADPH-quinone reductase
MKVLTIYAHNDPHSFCHGVLQRFTDGLRDAGNTGEVVDLDTIRRYLDQACNLGGTFERDTRAALARPSEQAKDGATGPTA